VATPATRPVKVNVLKPPLRVWLRRSALIAALVGVVVAALAVAAPYVISGPRLGRVIGWALPPMRGHVHVGGGSWSWGAAWEVFRGRPGVIVLEDVLVTDADGARVLQARQITTALQLDRDRRDVVLHDLKLTDGFWRMARTKDRRGIGFLTAFEGPPAPKPSTTMPASPTAKASTKRRPASFRIAEAQLHNLTAEFDLPGWALTLRQVDTRGSLAVGPDAGGRVIFTFEVLNADVRDGGMVAVLDGARRLTLPFSSTRIARIATTAAAPDAIEIDADEIATGRSRSSLHGRFTRVFGRGTPPGPPGAALAVRITAAADAASAVALGHPQVAGMTVAGPGAELTFSIAGPLAAPLIVADARGFDFQVRGLALGATAFHLESHPAARQVQLTQLGWDSPTGGRVTIDVGLERLLARCHLRFEHFDVGPYLPAALRPVAAGTLDGHLRAEADLGRRTAGIDDTDLTVTRPARVPGPAVIHVLTGRGKGRARELLVRLAPTVLREGTLTLPRVSTTLWGGRVTASGRLRLWDPRTTDWMPSPSFALELDAQRISFEQLVGANFAVGALSLRALVTGTLQELEVEATFAPHQRLTILDDWVELPPSVSASVDTVGLTVPRLTLRGEDDSALSAQGRIAWSGGLEIDVEVARFPLRKLPALGDLDIPLAGELQGQLRLSGTRGAPAVAGRLAIVGARFQGQPIGGGTLIITPSAHGGMRARGQVIDGVTADGTITPGRTGTNGELALTLRQVRLDPFLTRLPGGASATGIVSGGLKARVAPGRPPSLDARVSELALLIAAPPLHATPIDFRSEGELHLAAQGNGGPITLHPARFTLLNRAGTLELSGRLMAGAGQARARGHLDLGALGTVTKPWVERLAGAMDFEAAATIEAKGAHPRLRGSVAVTSPVRLRLRRLPIEAQVPTGLIAVTEVGVSTRDLPITLGRQTLWVSGQVARTPKGPRLTADLRGGLDPRLLEPFVRTVVRQIDGQVGLSAHLDGPLVRPDLRARLDVGKTEFTLVEGGRRIQIPTGEITLSQAANERRAEVRALEIRAGTEARVSIGDRTVARLRFAPDDAFRLIGVELPARGQVHGLPTPDVIVDDAAFTLRLSGDPEKQMRLSGDVEVSAAHIPERLRNRKKTPPAAAAKSRARAALERTQLDVRIHSQKGAVAVELDHAPDLSVDVDYRIGGTLAKPKPDGHLKGADLYSRVLMFLAGLK
jgi:hypothetical protein